VVVPVHNEAATLDRCIDSILAQSYPADHIEVIFVDNRSSDSSSEILLRRGKRIVALEEKKPSAAAARNAGVRAARNHYVAFTDADCVADPDWIFELVRCTIEHPRADYIGGQIAALESGTLVERFEGKLHDQKRNIEVYRPSSVASGNFLISRQRLLEIGLFDESFARGEDSELCYRAVYRHGSRFAYADKAVIYHANRRSRCALFRMGLSHGQSSARLWHCYAADLGLSRRKRCMNPRSYRDPLQQLWRELRRGQQHRPEVEESRQFAMCDALFRFAKELGFLAGTLRYR
jgi:glycosyltransferase involved in cell wall biosynthesis